MSVVSVCSGSKRLHVWTNQSPRHAAPWGQLSALYHILSHCVNSYCIVLKIQNTVGEQPQSSQEPTISTPLPHPLSFCSCVNPEDS